MAKAKSAAKKTPKKRAPRGKNKPRTTKRSALDGGSKIDPERLQMVERMMRERRSQRVIVKAVMEEYGVIRATANNYYLVVEREWHDTTKEKRSYSRFKALKTLDEVITKAIEDRSWNAVVQAIKVQARLQGLNEPDEVVIKTDTAHPTEGMTSAQRRSYIAEKIKDRESLLEKIVRNEPTKNSMH